MNDNTIINQTGKIVLMASAAYVTTYFANPILTTALYGVTGSVAANLASGYLDRFLEGGDLKRAFFSSHPDQLNHHLHKLLFQSTAEAITNIGKLYAQQLTSKSQKRVLKRFISALKNEVNRQAATLSVSDKAVMKFTGSIGKIPSKEILNKLGIMRLDLPQVDPNFSFSDFFSSQFMSQLQLNFGEALKTPKNSEAWVAYQRLMIKDTKAGLKQLISQNKAMKRKIDQLDQQPTPTDSLSGPDRVVLENLINTLNDPSINLEKHLKEALTELIARERNQLNDIIKLNRQTYRNVKNIQNQVSEVDRTVRGFSYLLSANWISKFWLALTILISVSIIVFIGVYMHQQEQPFDQTIYLAPADSIHFSTAYPYPVFTQGELIIRIGNEERKRPILADGEVIFRQLPAHYRGAKVAIRLKEPYWQTSMDSIQLSASGSIIPLIPNGRLGKIIGNVKSEIGLALTDVSITVDNYPQSFLTDKLGYFQATLPYAQQKDQYQLTFYKAGFQTKREIYYPESGSIDIRLASK